MKKIISITITLIILITSCVSSFAKTGDTVSVAIFDHIVDISHKDLKPYIWINEKEAINNIDDDGNGFIDDINGFDFSLANPINIEHISSNHGTHIAGIVKEMSHYSALIMSLGVYGDETGNSESLFLQAAKYAEQQGAKICNLSFLSHYDESVDNYIKKSNMLFVCAAGNDAINIDQYPLFPAACDVENIITVANITNENVLNKTSNYGAKNVDIAAYGTDIYSTVPGNKYGYMTGTSMSAPAVAGAAARLMAYDSAITAIDVKNILMASAIKVDALKDKVACGGYLSADDAMAMAKAMSFYDVFPVDECYDACAYLFDKGIMNGTSEKHFSPNLSLTRAMAITILGRAAESMGLEIEESDTRKFSDADYDSWYGKYLNWASDNGIILGYSNGNFGPEDYLQSYQLGLMLERFAKLIDKEYQNNLIERRTINRGETAKAIYEFLK